MIRIFSIAFDCGAGGLRAFRAVLMRALRASVFTAKVKQSPQPAAPAPPPATKPSCFFHQCAALPTPGTGVRPTARLFRITATVEHSGCSVFGRGRLLGIYLNPECPPMQDSVHTIQALTTRRVVHRAVRRPVHDCTPPGVFLCRVLPGHCSVGFAEWFPEAG